MIKVRVLSPDKGPIVGFSLVAHPKIVASNPAAIFLVEEKEENKVEVPLTFLRGDLNIIRVELHKLIDEAIEQLIEE
jgi:hypothetical protein